MATIVFPIGNIMVRGIIVCTIAGSFAANLQLTNDCLAPVALLVLQIHGYRSMSTIGHIAFVRYLIMSCQPSLLTLHLLAESVSLLLFGVHANNTEFCFFITRWWLPSRSLFVVLRLLVLPDNIWRYIPFFPQL